MKAFLQNGEEKILVLVQILGRFLVSPIKESTSGSFRICSAVCVILNDFQEITGKWTVIFCGNATWRNAKDNSSLPFV